MTATTEGKAEASSNMSHQLHDLFSTAQLESALSSFNRTSTKEDKSFSIRLPFLLRCLASLQSRSDIAPFLNDYELQTTRLNVNLVSRLLEDVAVSHPGAENIELLLAIAPLICGNTMGKIHHVSRCKHNAPLYTALAGCDDSGNFSIRDTKGLSAALQRLSTLGDVGLNKRSIHEEHLSGKRQKIDNDDSSYDSDDMEILPPTQSTDKKEDTMESSNTCTIHPASFAANDTYESAMRRTLQELIFLVKSSLDTKTSTNCDIQNQCDEENVVSIQSSFYKETGVMAPVLSIKSESLFAEINPTSSSFGGSLSSLCAMVITLMHHAPILRHEHVANALCRAAVPQAPSLIKHIAANCPAVITCLLKGIINAYKLAERYRFLKPDTSNTLNDDIDLFGSGPEVSDILRTAKESTKSIASLSRSETFNVIHMLRKYHAIDELVLELLIDQDPIAGASFIVEKLSTGFVDDGDSNNTRRCLHDLTVLSEEDQSQSLPLRQRIIGSQQCLDNCMPLSRHNMFPSEENTQSNLAFALKENHILVKCCLQSISNKMEAAKDSDVSLGETSLLLRAFDVLMHYTDVDIESLNQILDHVLDLVKIDNSHSDVQRCSPYDDFYKLGVCTTIIAWSKFTLLENSMTDSDRTASKGKLRKCLGSLLDHKKSLECIVFLSRVSGFIIGNDASGLRSMLVDHIYSGKYRTSVASLKIELKRMSSVITCVLSSVGVEKLKRAHKSALTLSATTYNPIVAIDNVRRSGISQYEELDDLITSIITDTRSCRDILFHPKSFELMQESVKMLSRRNGPHIPLVLPLSLKRKVISIPWSSPNTPEFQELMPQFILQLLYALLFLEEEPASPFVINPREFPFKEVLNFVTGVKLQQTIHAVLERLISKHCPDIITHVNNLQLMDCSGSAISGFDDIDPSKLFTVIRDCLDQEDVNDQSGIRAEKIYLMSSSRVPIDTLVTSISSAVLASNHSQPKLLSYVQLCKDPLVIFKAEASTWRCDGVRRLVLKVLCHLMAANRTMVIESSKCQQVARELLFSRDSIILRCLLVAQTNLCSTHCVLALNIIRSIVSGSRGIIASLLKQGLDERMIDYLCKFVPESFSDAAILSSILSSKEAMSTPDRLVLADASLRIADAHSSRGESIAKRLVGLSLSVLVESFQFVLGPVGVPVSVLRGQTDSEDSTDICRNAMFRMISALSTVHPDSCLKGHCVSTIGRIASMCKSESSSVGSGAVAVWRKALLKKVWEACGDANTALGGEIQI